MFRFPKKQRVVIAVLMGAVICFVCVSIFWRGNSLHVNLGLLGTSLWGVSGRNTLENVLRHFSERRQLILDECKRDDPRDFQIFRRQKRPWISFSLKLAAIGSSFQVLYCPVYKAASSSWLATFAFFSGALTDVTAFKLRNANGSTTLKELATRFRMFTTSYDIKRHPESTESKQIRIVVVRHPFERILSAYRDKLEKARGREYYYEMYGKPIVDNFRNNGEENDTIKTITPTFEEFCQFLSTTTTENWRSKFNEHWSPQYIDCPPCSSNFDVIVKVETMTEDREMILKLLTAGSYNLTQVNDVFESWAHVNRAISKKQYFQQLSLPLMKKLYSLYEKDFTYFNYSADEYYKLAKVS